MVTMIMRSKTCAIKKGGEGLKDVLAEVEKIADYNELPKKQTLRLSLLAEELVGMLPELVKNFEGSFWIQSKGTQYELHVELLVDSLSKERKEALIEVSANKKNAANTGFMGKIRDIAENMLLRSEEDFGEVYAVDQEYMTDYQSFDYHYTYAWTLNNYVSNKQESTDSATWDELEKSIVAKLADDVIVGVRGKKVEIVIKKEF